jgi:putative transposase
MAERKGSIDPAHSLSVRTQCKLLEVCRTSLYYEPTEKTDDVRLLNLIREIWQKWQFYGYRKITAVLKGAYQEVVNPKRVQRLMAIAGLKAIYPKRNLSKKRQGDVVREYLLRELVISNVNQVWMVDITYLKLGSRFVYLVAFIDVYSRYVVGWQLSYDLDTESSLEALRLSLMIGTPNIINSDQGCQYTSEQWISTLTQLGILISHDGVGRWADNIYIERFWRSIKYEAIYLNEFDDYAQLYSAVRRYIDFYNHQRPHQALKYQTPAAIYQGLGSEEGLFVQGNKKEKVKLKLTIV